MLFSDNISGKLSIDEVSLSKGELYTLVTSKKGQGKKGTIVACIGSTKAEDIAGVLKKINLEKRRTVTEITLDMAPNMASACKEAFPMAKLVVDRFHVIRLAMEAIQTLRTGLRWEEMDKENEAIKLARSKKERYEPKYLANGDTVKQLLARSKYVLAKKKAEWTETQKTRAELLFQLFPKIKEAYFHVLELRVFYQETFKENALIRMKNWIDKTSELELKNFNSVANSLENHSENILNFFDNRSTNASAESFNAKLKLFRANLRGVTDVKFFLFRLAKLYA